MDPAAWGALLSGLGSLLAALFSVRGVKKRARDDCDKRIAELAKAFHEGRRLEMLAQQRRRRHSD